MNMRNEILIAALCAVCAGAMANVTTSTVGPTTTYSESFAVASADGTQYLLNNPGPNNTTGFLNYNSYDAFYTTTLNNLVAGTYAVTFATPGLLTSLKVDDLTITAVAAPVPEPETYAMMLAGLAMIGWLNKLNRDSRRGSGR